MIPFANAKAALAAAGRLARRLDVRARQDHRVQQSPRDEQHDRVIAVRAALRAARVDPDGADAQLLYAWATTDDRRDVFDDQVEASTTESEYSRAVELGEAARARLAELQALVGPVLLELGVVRPALRLMRAGWRVLEIDGHRVVHLVTDFDADDETVLRSLEHAHAIARGDVEGPVVAATRTREISSRPIHPEIATEWIGRWEAGEFETTARFDEALASSKQWSRGWATRVRLSWGIAGKPGRPRK